MTPMRTLSHLGITTMILATTILGTPVMAAKHAPQSSWAASISLSAPAEATGTAETDQDLGLPKSGSKSIYTMVINTLKPSHIEIPDFLKISYYKKFLLEVNNTIAESTGVNILNSIFLVIHWFTVFIDWLRELLLKIPNPTGYMNSATSTQK